MEIYADACTRGSAEACAFRGLHLVDDKDAKPDDVVNTLKRACDLGSSAGCAHLAFLYATGTVVAQDDARATPLYVRACDLGDARGCYNVGLMYAAGRGVAADMARAMTAYDEAAAAAARPRARTSATRTSTAKAWRRTRSARSSSIAAAATARAASPRTAAPA